MTLAVVGHVEWVDFVVAPRLPATGEILQASSAHEAAAGGGAMAAYAMRSLTGACTFFCAVGEDHRAAWTVRGLEAAGLEVRAAVHAGRTQRRTITHLTDDGERTITVLGPPLEPRSEDDLPWDALAPCDGALVVTGDAGAIRAARAARVLVSTPRARAALLEAGVAVDALVGSATDPHETIDDALRSATRPRYVVETEGAQGGRWRAADGRCGRWEATSPPSDPVDAFGCGDAFAAALTAGLASGRSIEEACALGARVGAAVLCERAPAVGDLSRWS
ncbi:MAG TPA: PfkB family carbohydrate kinase [Baekduia sp.]|uniref:PfkB family carbohydrate kinase n=1 Tax=Baekduia sp. TaxID=2600305 RepID=UPI002CB33F6E|nr:PfkB family carbohydrate kinase [Baekduia sp.]HMJ36589.1 PfkB family carbohydrate kinase [Baekduia sp.]